MKETYPTNCHSEVLRGISLTSQSIITFLAACAERCRSIFRGISLLLQSTATFLVVCRGILICCLNVLLFLVVSLFNLPQAVLAHSQPLKLEPAPGASLTQSPSEIRLTFTEPVRPDATISLFPQDSFTSVTGIMTQQDPTNPAQIFAHLPPLSSDTYTVQWQIQSSDGHTLSGTYTFSIRSNPLLTLLPWLLIPIILLAAILISHRRRHA